MVFYCVNAILLIKYLLIARKWSSLASNWNYVEEKLPKIKAQARVIQSIQFLAFCFLLVAFTEHLLSILSTLINVMECPHDNGLTEAFLRAHLGIVFDVLEYSLPLAVVSKWLNLVCTFSWSFNDFFIVMTATGLSNMFQRLNEFISSHDLTEVGEQFWVEQRRHYRRICDLIEITDQQISFVILVSFSSNLFFICLQLLNSLISE